MIVNIMFIIMIVIYYYSQLNCLAFPGDNPNNANVNSALM